MFSLCTLRDRDFCAACRHHTKLALDRGELITQHELARRAINSGAPGYYVDFEYARRVLYEIRATNRFPGEGTAKEELWRELQGHVNREMARSHLSLSDALQKVLSTVRASRFFISTNYATKLYSRHRRRSPLKH